MKNLAEIIEMYYSEENLKRSKKREIECKNTYSEKEIKKFRKREKRYNILKSIATLGTVGGLGYLFPLEFVKGSELSIYASAIGTLGVGATMGFASIKRNHYRKILGIPYVDVWRWYVKSGG